MKRFVLLWACLHLTSPQHEAWAQQVPIASAVSLEEFLANIGDEFGIVVTSEKSLDELITVQGLEEPLSTSLSQVLTRHSFLLIYSGRWTGSLHTSPNRLHIFADEVADRVRTLNGLSTAVDMSSGTDQDIDSIACIDKIVESAQGRREKLVTELALVIRMSGDESIREEAIYALAEIDMPGGIDVLVQALADESAIVREAVVMALADTRTAGGRSVLQLALTDRNPDVRAAAADALGLTR